MKGTRTEAPAITPSQSHPCMANKLNVDGILLFEQPFARVPYENYRKVFRTTQRNVERDLKAVQSTANELARQSSSGAVSSDAAFESIDAMIANVENLKRKLSELHDTAGKPTQDVIRERLQHLATVETIPTANDPEFGRWADTRLDRWLVDWALRNGKEKTARMIAKERHIETLVDIDLFSDIKRIEGALARHSSAEALSWCSENKTALRKLKSTLEFDLRLQEYIELSRARKPQEAIEYSRKHLVPWHETHLEEIQQAAGLLAFRPETAFGRYKRLYDPSRWAALIQSFRLAIYSLNSLPTEPLLNLSLYAGLASLKLPACGAHATKNVDCPVCDGEAGSGSQGLGLGKLAEEVPLSHHANSTIVCYITGKIMDADNMPLAFPDTGYVYSREAMEEMSLKNDGIVTCPRSKVTCAFSALRRVYIS
ncbi:CTLH/CRA C-terminal to lish motif domain-containing protein [Mycena crocata]|nr:CTLH/CRA C-terminal to lish motif domain-containing protein [Mycena crocata]